MLPEPAWHWTSGTGGDGSTGGDPRCKQQSSHEMGWEKSNGPARKDGPCSLFSSRPFFVCHKPGFLMLESEARLPRARRLLAPTASHIHHALILDTDKRGMDTSKPARPGRRCCPTATAEKNKKTEEEWILDVPPPLVKKAEAGDPDLCVFICCNRQEKDTRVCSKITQPIHTHTHTLCWEQYLAFSPSNA